ncbi:MAG: type II secretion system F family protein [Endomicrobiia bacterium]
MGNIKLISLLAFFVFGIFLTKDFFWSTILSLTGYITTIKIIKNYKISQREKFESQLVDAIQMLSGFVKSGLNLVQSIEKVEKNMGPPISIYFNEVLKQIQFGSPVDVALTEVSKKIESKEFLFAILTIKVAHKFGGNLSENLKNIANTLRERKRIKNKIKAITSQGRISAKMITFVPFLLLIVLNFLEPNIFGIMFKTTLGKLLFLLCLFSSYIGNWIISKIIEIDI